MYHTNKPKFFRTNIVQLLPAISLMVYLSKYTLVGLLCLWKSGKFDGKVVVDKVLLSLNSSNHERILVVGYKLYLYCYIESRTLSGFLCKLSCHNVQKKGSCSTEWFIWKCLTNLGTYILEHGQNTCYYTSTYRLKK